MAIVLSQVELHTLEVPCWLVVTVIACLQKYIPFSLTLRCSRLKGAKYLQLIQSLVPTDLTSEMLPTHQLTSTAEHPPCLLSVLPDGVEHGLCVGDPSVCHYEHLAWQSGAPLSPENPLQRCK